MPRARRWAERLRIGDDAGSASIEFLTVGLLLLVPLVYLVIALAAVQGGALGVEGAARQASRVVVQATDDATAASAARDAAEVTLADYGMDADAARVRIDCTPDPRRCLTRRGFVTVSVDASVPLPLIPRALQTTLPLRVPVRATATEQVSRFWGAR
jgi:Flp pilus assembly protein TadG